MGSLTASSAWCALQKAKRMHATLEAFCEMPGLQRETLHEYIGRPIEDGSRGRLQIFRVTQTSTALQPTHKHCLSALQSVVLNSGHKIPRIGLGTWKSEQGQVRDAVYSAIRAGYRHVDCAANYENEHEVGSALQQIFSERITCREDIFVTSKLWCVKRKASM